MKKVRGTVPTATLLDRKTCYYLRTGRCSLDVVESFRFAAPLKLNFSELLYCPRLAEAMRDKSRERTLTVMPCACGHAEIDGTPQKVCIAARLGLEVVLTPSRAEAKPLCVACGRQLTFDEEQPDREGARVYNLHAVIPTE